MSKKRMFKLSLLTAAFVGLLLLAACAQDPGKENSEQAQSQADSGTESEASEETSPMPDEESEISAGQEESSDVVIAKINGGADEVGIYSVVVRLTDQAADKGVIELVYYGAKGSPQEKSIVNTFRIEYWRESDGSFEIRTFSDGETYQNQHRKEEVKVTNTFGATLRAGSVIITYTPEGGEAQEIFRADASYFH